MKEEHFWRAMVDEQKQPFIQALLDAINRHNERVAIEIKRHGVFYQNSEFTRQGGILGAYVRQITRELGKPSNEDETKLFDARIYKTVFRQWLLSPSIKQDKQEAETMKQLAGLSKAEFEKKIKEMLL